MNQTQNINTQVNNQNQGLTIKDLSYIIKKHIIPIIAFIVVFTIGGYIVDRVLPPTYKSSGSMMVSYDSSSGAITSDYTFSNYITSTYVAFIKEDAVLDKVSERVGVPTGTLKGKMKVTNTALLINVSYEDSDPDKAMEIANVIIDTAQEVADSTILVEGEEKAVYHLLYDNLKVLTYAKKGGKVSHTTRDLAIGFALGIVLAFIYVVMMESFDNRFKSSEDLERTLGIPVLAGIPEYMFEDEKKGGLIHGK